MTDPDKAKVDLSAVQVRGLYSSLLGVAIREKAAREDLDARSKRFLSDPPAFDPAFRKADTKR